MMGEGVIELSKIRGWVEDAGYAVFREVEIFSQFRWWQAEGDDVLGTCIGRLRSLLRVCKRRTEDGSFIAPISKTIGVVGTGSLGSAIRGRLRPTENHALDGSDRLLPALPQQIGQLAQATSS